MPSNKYDLRKAPEGGITVHFYRKEKKYEIFSTDGAPGPDGKIGYGELCRLMVKWLHVPAHELALAYTEFHFRPQTSRAEFGIDGQFLFVN